MVAFENKNNGCLLLTQNMKQFQHEELEGRGGEKTHSLLMDHNKQFLNHRITE